MARVWQTGPAVDLALIGNGSYQALIGGRGDVQWLCLPRFDSSFVVGPLLDEKNGGAFLVEPVEAGFTVTQKYVENTAIVETTWCRPGESFTVTDFAPRFVEWEDTLRPRTLVRKVQVAQGKPKVRYRYEPVYDYGRSAPPDDLLHLQCSAELGSCEEFELSDTLFLALTWGKPIAGDLAETCEQLLADTSVYWREWVHSLEIPSRFAADVVRSAITLKLHQFGDTGAITAAATTSIPEHPGSGRTWDYRFCWPRDSYFTVDALLKLGSTNEVRGYVDFLAAIADANTDFQPLYGIGGECEVEEEILVHLAGYQGEGPVRIGNQAYKQVQYDIFGEMICSIAPIYAASPSDSLRALLLRLLDDIEKHFVEPDAGLWEKRDVPARHTFSLLMHWLGAQAVHALGDRHGDETLLTRGSLVMERARTCIDEHCWNEERGFYTETVDGERADASLLFMVSVGYFRAGDARAKRHLESLRQRLAGDDGLFKRYVHDDGLGETLVSFTACTLWYAEALAHIGEVAEAERVLSSVLARANHVGLLSEDIDPVDGALWGNFPQTYSHVGIIRCALALAAASA